MEFEGSEDASESSEVAIAPPAPQPAAAPSPTTLLVRRLTQDRIDLPVTRRRSPSNESPGLRRRASTQSLVRSDSANSFGSDAQGLKLSSESDDAPRPSLASLPSSPATARKTRQPKASQLLGLTPSGLRKEKREFVTRLRTTVQSDAYLTDLRKKLADQSKRVSAGGSTTLLSAATAQSMVLTSDDIPLEAVILMDPMHRKTFRMFAESLFCAESLLFWERVNEFRVRAAADPETARSLAANIWTNFLSASADKQLTLSAGLAASIKSLVDANAVDEHIFDAAQREALSTMRFSLYPQYLAYLNRATNSDPATPKSPTSPTSPISPTSAAAEPKAVKRSTSGGLEGVPTLRQCLTKREETVKFIRFAETLMCAENVLFWLEVNEFQALTDDVEMVAMSLQIWEEVRC